MAASAKTSNAFDLALEMLREPIPLASERSRELGARDLGPGFDAWFARAVDRDPTRRHRDAGEAWTALEGVWRGDAAEPANASVSLSEDSAIASATPTSRVRGIAVAVALVVVMGLALWLALRG